MADDSMRADPEAGGLRIGGVDAAIGEFADTEQAQLLQYIYFGDIRGGAILGSLGAALMLYLIQPRPTISSGTLQFFHDAFVACCLLAGTLVFLFIGIALCPIPWRGKLPKRGPKGSHSSISHYLDITSFDDGDQYIERLLAIRADDTGPIDGLTREKLRACYEMANIAKDKMSLIARGFGAAAACVLFLLLDLAIFTAHLGQ